MVFNCIETFSLPNNYIHTDIASTKKHIWEVLHCLWRNTSIGLTTFTDGMWVSFGPLYVGPIPMPAQFLAQNIMITLQLHYRWLQGDLHFLNPHLMTSGSFRHLYVYTSVPANHITFLFDNTFKLSYYKSKQRPKLTWYIY